MISETYLNTAQVAELLGMNKATIEAWRYKGDGPPHIKLGTGPRPAIRYAASDVQRWIAAQTIGGAS